MTKGELLQLENTLGGLKNIAHTKLAYVIIKNLRILKKEIDKIKEINKNKPKHPKFPEFEAKRVALCNQHCKKDEKGNPIIIQNTYEMVDKEAFDKAYGELKLEYQEIIDEDNKRREEFEAILKEEVEIEFYKIREADLPDNLTANQLEKLELIIN